MHITTTFLALGLYLTCGILLLFRLLGKDLIRKLQKPQILLLVLVALIFHTIALYHDLFTPTGLDIGFFNVLSLVAWLVVLLLTLAAITMQVECLGVIVYPFAAGMLLISQVSDQHHILPYHMQAGIQLHILISILAYSVLSIAAVQAILLYVQDVQLHNKHPGGFIRSFPPLQTMETLLFRMITIGFVVLGLSLLSGVIYLEDMFAQHLVHKTILSIAAWVLFGILLWGRRQFGWRGRIAIRWTISGFVLLMLAYFGSKFVIELVLNRAG
ncbi:MAG: cytochrome c biogenesis protein CcsA [Gammaproteobacteria bacterium]|nr:cytochrome c biogenesis protein CcsA [Gammaproteobacteria bacterium]MDH5651388.1 cytochrome c biogenesis protein CcsA [Gammaproteobacteria bacterium]